MPAFVDEYNVFRCELIFFKGTKSALISYHNSSEDKLFAFFDNRNKSRLNKLSGKAIDVWTLSGDLQKMAEDMQKKIDGITKIGNINKEHQKRMQKHKDDLLQEGNNDGNDWVILITLIYFHPIITNLILNGSKVLSIVNFVY